MAYTVKLEITNWPVTRSIWTARPLVELFVAGITPDYMVHGNTMPHHGRCIKSIYLRFNTDEVLDEFVWLRLKYDAKLRKVRVPQGAEDWCYPGPKYHNRIVLPERVRKRFFSK